MEILTPEIDPVAWWTDFEDMFAIHQDWEMVLRLKWYRAAELQGR